MTGFPSFSRLYELTPFGLFASPDRQRIASTSRLLWIKLSPSQVLKRLFETWLSVFLHHYPECICWAVFLYIIAFAQLVERVQEWYLHYSWRSICDWKLPLEPLLSHHRCFCPYGGICELMFDFIFWFKGDKLCPAIPCLLGNKT